MYKKTKLKIITFFVAGFYVLLPLVTFASSISLRSSSKTVEPNKTFNVSVYVNPSSVASYTAQANLKFPADLVSVQSFTYASSWFPINQSGYDVVDNTSGKIIKTAGYPSGFTTEILLGTIVFKVKKAGNITISTNNESYILDIDSKNTLNGYGTFSITASSPVLDKPVVTTPPTPTKVTTSVTTIPAKTTTTPVKDVVKPQEEQQAINSTAIVAEDKNAKDKLIFIIGMILGALSSYLSFK